ncbi:S-methyl-5'-thioadenosine phosphorylase [Sphingomonas oleivorans]|uniref:S-methyl-5'-thioadenosine phosphorylase n=1 Tax=Sphingomonas oleivorans TaxID=1735121 RepID=A0A2T5FXR8_9SPHN|nr:S-methyl-5'-thioadenosine phosphorylase [Sphingomonas oleivorans]PTQ10931.1 S-methyl-5'-thioadenosine phosphorylase [Sphingomonas oleivorans]
MRLGLIGGSGFYQLSGLEEAEWHAVETPWGQPSDRLLFGRIGDTELVFLPRHGRGHHLTPSEINYRANIDAMKRVGCQAVLSLAACGSYREELRPGMFVLVDQFLDRTFRRVNSFFGDGVVAHVAMAEPTCADLSAIVAEAAKALEIPHARGGTYVATEGPHFSTRAESLLHRAAGHHVVGMTNMPEAILAREAELCYLTVAMVTDYDSWLGGDQAVDVAQILSVMRDNVGRAKRLVEEVARRLPADGAFCFSGCRHALDNAILSDPSVHPPETVARLDVVAGRVLR